MKTQYLSFGVIVVVASHICLETAVTAQSRVAPPQVSTRQPEAVAEPVPSPCKDKPWYCDVSREQRERATELFQQGNRLFDDSLFLPASAMYREALAHWEHPTIRYNLMLALIGLDKPIEAYQSAQKALQYGEHALEPDDYRHARDYLKLLSGRIVEIEVACNEPGATVSLDGTILFEAPGRVRRLVLPGQHEVVAKKKGYLTTHAPLVLLAHEPTTVELDMLHEDQAVLIERRWPAWQPWTVVGAGVGLALVGGVLQWRADVNNQRYEELFDQECTVPDGCQRSDYRAKLHSFDRHSTWYQRISYGSYAVAGTAVTTGLVLVYLNLPTRRDNPRREHLVHISAAPAFSPSFRGLAMDVGF